MATPETLDLTRAAQYLLVCDTDRTISDHAYAAYAAALDLWEALTGLTGDEALDYARACVQHTTTAVLPPF